MERKRAQREENRETQAPVELQASVEVMERYNDKERREGRVSASEVES